MDRKTSEVSNDGQTPGKSSLLSKSAEGAILLIVVQIGSRGLTFAVNQLPFRYLTPLLLGIFTQLEVYFISVLFFARESLRVAIQRQTDTNIEDEEPFRQQPGSAPGEKRELAARKTQEIINLAYVSICLGIFFAFILAWAYLRSLRSDLSVLKTPFFKQALQIYGFAAFIELLAEPCFVVVQQKSEYKIRAAAESVATVLRCLVTYGLAVLAARKGTDLGILPLAVGRLAYGLSLLFVYYTKVRAITAASGVSLVPRLIVSRYLNAGIWFLARMLIRGSSESDFIFSYFSRSLLALGIRFFMQGVVKHVLTHGDVILVSYLASPEALGIYALASNYGGLIARMVFQPIEESSRNYFGKLLSTVDAKPSKAVIESGSRSLHNLLRFYILLSISAVTVGPTVAPLLLNVVAGSTWVDIGAGDVLAKYCYYIPLLAVNGVTEAFISSIATESELNRQSAWMFAFSIGFAVAGYVFLRLLDLGAEGLVWANTVNMGLRILWSSNFIKSYLKRNGSHLNISAMMPRPVTIAVGVSTAAVLAQMQGTFTGGALDFIKSGLVAGAFIILV
jgi:oligosaccharide translocation protein RFT1